MPASGLTCFSPRFSYPNHCNSLSRLSVIRGFSPIQKNDIFRQKLKLPFLSSDYSDRKYVPAPVHNSPFQHTLRVSMDASFGNLADDADAFFPRINTKDPYKRIGVSREASEEEIQAARKFLLNKYAGHQPSIDAIESAHDKIIMQKFHERRKPKINIDKNVKKVTQSRVFKTIATRFETPSKNHILKTTAAFVILGVLTVLFPTEEGPTLQVAISLMASVYFMYGRQKSQLFRAFLYGAGSFIVSWLLGTFLMVSIIPPILHGPRSLEVTTSLISYVILWVSSTYLK